MSDMTETLAPCPMCGSTVIDIAYNDEDGGHHIECVGCRLKTDVYRTETTATAAWNRRHVTPTVLEAARRILSGKDENGRQNVDYGPSAEAVARELLRIGGET